MKKSRRLRSLKRSIIIATLLTGLAGGAAYAVLQTQDTLTGNTISTATANLQTTTAGSVTRPAATLALGSLKGVYVVTAGGTTANTMNAIIATAGPAYVKSTAGSVQGDAQTGSTTAGYAITVTTVPAPTIGYGSLGIAQSAFSSTCSANTDLCRGSLAVTLSIR